MNPFGRGFREGCSLKNLLREGNIMKMTLEEKIGQLLMASLDGMTLDGAAERFLRENHIGNIIHFGNNLQSREQAVAFNGELMEAIQARCGIAPLIAVDHEGGRVVRFQAGVTDFPSPMAVGAAGDPALAEAVGRAMGEELASLGFHINIAPAVDVNTNPKNPVIGTRSFGDEPEKVAVLGTCMALGMQSAGLMACAKHFPGHGDTAMDSHFGLPRVDKSLEALEREELVPFAMVVREGVETIMTSHILYPALEPQEVPATMSRRILIDLLRVKMGFTGLIISDGMQMHAITEHFGIERGCVEALKAGCDLLCIGTGGAGVMDVQASCYQALLDAARLGEVPMERIDDAVQRVLAAKGRYGIRPQKDVAYDAHGELARHVAEKSITWLRGEGQPLEGRIVCVSTPATQKRYGVAEGNWRTKSFESVAAEALGGDAGSLEAGSDMTGVLARADTVVMDVGQGTETELAFIAEAIRQEKRVFVVLTGLPYVAERLPSGCAVLCAYGATPVSIRAACRALRGEIKLQGTLPVRLS